MPPPAGAPDAAPSPARLERFRSPLKALAVGLVALLLMLAFAQLAGEVLEGDTRGFDLHVLDAARSLRLAHPWLGEAMRDLSGLGSTVVLAVLSVGTVGYLAAFSSRTTAAFVALSVASGALLVIVFKAAFGRLRPDPAFAELVVAGQSFPSGHASVSAIVFLTLGALVAATRSRWGERAYILACAALLAGLVGLSRVALGVHWATDVLAGWAFGAAWAIVWLLVERGWVRRHRERSRPP